MKIAFDVHGTLDRCPHDIITWMKMFRGSGHEVCIISGPPILQIKEELFKIHQFYFKDFIQIYSVVDWIKAQNYKMIQNEDGSWSCEEFYWWRSKGKICREYNIDILIDNDLRYKKNMPLNTSFVHWDRQNLVSI